MAVKLIASSALISVPSYLTKMFLQQRLVELGWPTELLFLPSLLAVWPALRALRSAAG